MGLAAGVLPHAATAPPQSSRSAKRVVVVIMTPERAPPIPYRLFAPSWAGLLSREPVAEASRYELICAKRSQRRSAGRLLHHPAIAWIDEHAHGALLPGEDPEVIETVTWRRHERMEAGGDRRGVAVANHA